MEKQPHQEYRDDLADKLKEIRNSDPENPKFAKGKARGYLDAKKEQKSLYPFPYDPYDYEKSKLKHDTEKNTIGKKNKIMEVTPYADVFMEKLKSLEIKEHGIYLSGYHFELCNNDKVKLVIELQLPDDYKDKGTVYAGYNSRIDDLRSFFRSAVEKIFQSDSKSAKADDYTDQAKIFIPDQLKDLDKIEFLFPKEGTIVGKFYFDHKREIWWNSDFNYRPPSMPGF